MPGVTLLNVTAIQAIPAPLESATSSPTKVRAPSPKPTSHQIPNKRKEEFNSSHQNTNDQNGLQL